MPPTPKTLRHTVGWNQFTESDTIIFHGRTFFHQGHRRRLAVRLSWLIVLKKNNQKPLAILRLWWPFWDGDFTWPFLGWLYKWPPTIGGWKGHGLNHLDFVTVFAPNTWSLDWEVLVAGLLTKPPRRMKEFSPPWKRGDHFKRKGSSNLPSLHQVLQGGICYIVFSKGRYQVPRKTNMTMDKPTVWRCISY